MVDDADIVTHADPALRGRTNYIGRLDLAAYGLAGRWEQVWLRTDDEQQTFELCCIPFFTYGISLRDVLEIDLESGAHEVVAKSGHRTIRYVFQDQRAAHDEHDRLHGALVGLGSLVEFRGHANGYTTIDLGSDEQAAAVIELLAPLAATSQLVWEWADGGQGSLPPDQSSLARRTGMPEGK